MSIPTIKAERVDIECYADADFPGQAFQLYKPDDTVIDATGWTFTWSVRAFDDASGPALISAPSSAGSGPRIVWLNQAISRFTIAVDKSHLAALPRNGLSTNEPTKFRHQLMAVNGDSDVRLFFGTLIVWGAI